MDNGSGLVLLGPVVLPAQRLPEEPVDLLAGHAQLLGDPSHRLPLAEIDQRPASDDGQPADGPAVLIHERRRFLDA